MQGGGARVVVSTADFHARVRDLFPGLGGVKETKMFLPHSLVHRSRRWTNVKPTLIQRPVDRPNYISLESACVVVRR